MNLSYWWMREISNCVIKNLRKDLSFCKLLKNVYKLFQWIYLFTSLCILLKNVYFCPLLDMTTYPPIVTIFPHCGDIMDNYMAITDLYFCAHIFKHIIYKGILSQFELMALSRMLFGVKKLMMSDPDATIKCIIFVLF